MQKTKKKRFLSIMLSFAMIPGVISGGSLTALAESTGAYNDFLVKTDANKEKNNEDLKALQVTFNDMAWYIIDDDSTSKNAGTVTLLAANEYFGSSAFDSNGGTDYSTSTVKRYLDEVIAGAAGPEKPDFSQVASMISDTENGKLYLLSTEEVTEVPVHARHFTAIWGLRSVCTGNNSQIARVFCGFGHEGMIQGDYASEPTTPTSVRPALKLDLSKVRFKKAKKAFVAPTNVDMSGLDDAIADAETLYDSIKEDTDYADIAGTLKPAIDAANAVADDDNADQAAVDKAKDDITAALAAAKAAKQEIDKAVDDLTAMINDLPEPEDVTVDDKEDIEAAREAYEKLTENQKARVSPDLYQKLTDDEDAFVEAVLKAFNEFEDTLKKVREEADKKAADAQQAQKTAEEAKKAAEEELAKAEQAKKAADAKLAGVVAAMLNALPAPEDITKDNAYLVAAARGIYDQLTEEQKAVVGKEALKKLTDDEAAVAALKDDAKPKDDAKTLKGDVNSDGKVDVTDISKTAAHVKGVKLLDEDAAKAADVNADGKINVTDISKIAAHVKGTKLID